MISSRLFLAFASPYANSTYEYMHCARKKLLLLNIARLSTSTEDINELIDAHAACIEAFKVLSREFFNVCALDLTGQVTWIQILEHLAWIKLFIYAHETLQSCGECEA